MDNLTPLPAETPITPLTPEEQALHDQAMEVLSRKMVSLVDTVNKEWVKAIDQHAPAQASAIKTAFGSAMRNHMLQLRAEAEALPNG